MSPSFIAVTDGLVLLAVVALLVSVYWSWLHSYRVPKAASDNRSLWFSLPAWAQIVAGFAISLIGAAICYFLWLPLPILVSLDASLFLRIVGIVFIGGGVLLWFWARWALGAMMGISTASAAPLHDQHQLIQDGPYAIIRHPMYVGYWLLLLGLTITYRTWPLLIILILIIFSLSRRARREDLTLEAAFRDAWRQYAERVPMFIPRRK